MTETYIMKAGWLHRKSSILKRWKKSWFVLYTNGELKHFESQDKFEPEGGLNVLAHCMAVKCGDQCEHSPPDNLPGAALLTLTNYENENWDLCAENEDDAVAWKLAIAEAKKLRPPAPTIPSYEQIAATQSLPYGYQRIEVVHRGRDGNLVVPERIIEHPDGSRTVIIGRDGVPYHSVYCNCRRGYDCGCGTHYGSAALGLATGALLLSPFMWSPFFWW